ncbi:MAG: thioesterase family protein, partial [Casimicrobiaceae bacterium]
QVHRSIQSIRWGDMDALGHVNNTLVFRYMEQARLEWIYALAGHDNPYARGSGPLIVNASCTFLLPLVYPGDFEVTMSLAEPGRTSIGSFYQIVRDERMFAEGAARMVWVDLASGRPTPLPAAVRALVPTDNAGGDGRRDA